MRDVRALESELDDLRGQFGRVTVNEATDDVWLVELQIRGVDVRAVVETSSYPERPPSVSVEGGWHHPNVRRDGHVHALPSLVDWNRTLGLALVLRELNQRFIEHPPTR